MDLNNVEKILNALKRKGITGNPASAFTVIKSDNIKVMSSHLFGISFKSFEIETLVTLLAKEFDISLKNDKDLMLVYKQNLVCFNRESQAEEALKGCANGLKKYFDLAYDVVK